MTGRGDMRKFVRALGDTGLRVERANSGHWKVFAGPRLVAVSSGTPSDRRSHANFMHEVERSRR